jgi:hypothetical protein
MTTISLKLPTGLHAKLDRAARHRGQSKSELVRIALEQFLNGGTDIDGPPSALDLAGDLTGCVEGPGDLSINQKNLEDFGR